MSYTFPLLRNSNNRATLCYTRYNGIPYTMTIRISLTRSQQARLRQLRTRLQENPQFYKLPDCKSQPPKTVKLHIRDEGKCQICLKNCRTSSQGCCPGAAVCANCAPGLVYSRCFVCRKELRHDAGKAITQALIQDAQTNGPPNNGPPNNNEPAPQPLPNDITTT